MSVPHRSFRRTVLGLLCMLPPVCAAQNFQQFYYVPPVQLTGAPVSSIATGIFQTKDPGGVDIFYIDAPTVSAGTSSVTAGEFLNRNGGGFQPFNQDNITFTGVSNVVATLADFDGDGNLDYAFALSPVGSATTNLCVYYGTGDDINESLLSVTNSSYNGAAAAPNAYPPAGGKNGCMTFALASGSKPPNFSQIVAFPFKVGSSVEELLIEDSANNLLYVFQGNGATGTNGVLQGFKLLNTVSLAPADGAGPISTGDFNGDGYTDFIVNGQTDNSATVYFGDGNGNFAPQPPYHFDHNVHSMLLHDMNRDGIQDMVVEGDQGVIEIFPGTGATAQPFGTTSIGGTAPGVNGLSGNGGHLAAIDPTTLNILTVTPIGLSVLEGNGSLSYVLQGIYNIGPGRSSFALADFYDTGNLDLAVNSAEGIPIIRGNSNGSFQASNAYAALAPALGSVVGKFRNASINPAGNLDVVVNTGAEQGQLLTGDGTGAFQTFNGVTDPFPPTSAPDNSIPSSAWSNLLSGDFDGDGNPDLLYSLTGLPSPGLSGQFPILYIQYGNGDGTFVSPGFSYLSGSSQPGGPAGNGYYVESTVGSFNGAIASDIALIDQYAYGTVLGGLRNTLPAGSLAAAAPGNTTFDLAAAGFFKEGRASQQDLVFQEGANFVPYKNAQDGTGAHFTAMPALPGPGAPLYPSTLLLSDVDGDGNGDLVALYYNANFNPAGAGPVAPNDLYIWWGNGDGTFNPAPTVLTLTRNDYLGVVGDMNGDGLPDLVLADGSLVSILYNQGGAGSPANRTFGGEQDFLAGQGINSLSLANLTGGSLPDLIVANGGATISNALALGGGTASSLSLTPNPDVNTGGITVLMNDIATQPVVGTLMASPEPSAFGATFTLTAKIAPASGSIVPQGVVTFSIDGSPAPCSPASLVPAPGTATQAVATCVIPAGNAYASGTHTLSAAYSGNSVYTATTLAGTHQIVGSGTTTTIYLCTGPTPACPSTGYVMPPPSSTLQMYYGQTWNGTWLVTDTDGGPLPGNFELFDVYNGVSLPVLCDVSNTSGAACPAAVGVTVGTSVGTNVITGVYTGDSTHTGSTSAPVTITVLQDTTTAATLTGAPNPSPLGQPVTFTATLTGNYAAPTGPVQFVEFFPPSTVGTVLGSATLAPGAGDTSTATFTISTLPLGPDSIQAVYTGTTDFAATSSPVYIETITSSLAGGFTLAVTPNPVTAGVGLGAVLTVTVTSQNGFSQAVNLACSNLPGETSCSFTNPTIAAGGGSTSLVVFTTSPHTCGTTTPYFYGGLGKGPLAAPFALPALAGLVLLVVPRRAPGKRRWLRALLTVAVVATITQISGCTTCTDLGTRPATYTFQVTGTAANSSTTQSQTVTMTVTI